MMYDYIIEKPDLNKEVLAHYGIIGMKWKNHIKKNNMVDILNKQKMKLANGKGPSSSDKKEKPTKEQQAGAKEKYDAYKKMEDKRLKEKKQIYNYYMNKKKNAFMSRMGLRRAK